MIFSICTVRKFIWIHPVIDIRFCAADIAEPTRKEASPSPMQIKGRQPQAVVLSDSEDDQRVPDTAEKATPGHTAVDLTSSPASQDRGAAAAQRLLHGGSLHI